MESVESTYGVISGMNLHFCMLNCDHLIGKALYALPNLQTEQLTRIEKIEQKQIRCRSAHTQNHTQLRLQPALGGKKAKLTGSHPLGVTHFHLELCICKSRLHCRWLAALSQPHELHGKSVEEPNRHVRRLFHFRSQTNRPMLLSQAEYHPPLTRSRARSSMRWVWRRDRTVGLFICPTL